MRALLALVLAGLVVLNAPTTVAQTDLATSEATGPSTSFNLFALDGFGSFRIFDFNADYTARFGIPVPTPFRLSLPQNDNLELISDGAPDSGFASFTWVANVDGQRTFVENIRVFSAEWPLSDNIESREADILALIRDRIFARATAQFGGGQLVGWGGGDIGGTRALQAAGTYVDPTWGPMVLRIVAIPNTRDATSYFLMNSVSVDMVPIVHIDQLRSTLGGQTILSFRYLEDS